jgi:hypothetical protein
MPWAPDYVPVDGEEGLAAFVRAPADDPFLPAYGTAAARAVDDYCGRQFGQLDDPATLTYDGYNAVQLQDGSWVLPVDDVQDLTAVTVTVDGTAIAAGVDGYRWWEPDAIVKGYPHTALRLADQPCGEVEVFARFGWLAYPASVVGAVRFQVNRWHIRRESPYGIAGSPSSGSEMRLGANLDPDTKKILAGGRVVRARRPR